MHKCLDFKVYTSSLRYCLNQIKKCSEFGFHIFIFVVLLVIIGDVLVSLPKEKNRVAMLICTRTFNDKPCILPQYFDHLFN